ncbi:hypothetical protein VTK73DRAFT_3174 [Phialemonium thermophilum]|uniref:F-box domain-containing protein n=1 Tax=Phialemonium thermophilum TaxID=223376 RepID=A0ABR3VKI4_9PEZI
MSSTLISKTVTPFLREHIPGLYAPIGKADNEETSKTKEPNSRYCYRHRPDLKCRRAADESKMVKIQSELSELPPADQQAITHVWSLFSAAPAKHRVLMLQGVLQTCCFPQLSIVAREVHEQLKIDFITALPVEISQKILCYLDTVSLCRAAQVSRTWAELANDDSIWVHMCEQHIDRKCTRCGWKLPLLERKRLRSWARQQQLAKARTRAVEEIPSVPPTIAAPNTPRSPSPPKRDASCLDQAAAPKRQCVARVGSNGAVATTLSSSQQERERKSRPWKLVYKDRFQVGSNWKYGRAHLTILKGHTNGITCLQIDEGIMISGSYDTTARVWSLETGEELRVLRGHQKGIRSLQFDDQKLITGSIDGMIKIWNWSTGECLATLRGHHDAVVCVNFDGEILASGSADRSIKIFNFQTKVSYCLRGHSDWVNQVRIDTSSRTLLSASDDTTVKLWDLDSRSEMRTFVGHVGHVQQVLPLPEDFEPEDLNDVASTGLDNTDAASSSSSSSSSASVGTPAPPCPSQRDAAPAGPQDIRALYPGFQSDPTRPLPPRYMLTGGLDSTIRLWDTATGKCLKTFFGHVEGIWGLTGDTLRVVTAGNDGMVKVWDPRSGKCERTVTGHRGPVTSVGLSDSRMASGGDDGEIRVYSFDATQCAGQAIEVGTPN